MEKKREIGLSQGRGAMEKEKEREGGAREGVKWRWKMCRERG